MKEQRCRWLDGCVVFPWKTSEDLEKLLGVQHIATVIRSGRLRWYGHVMRKHYVNWVKKSMEYRIEGRRPVGRPRRTWLENVKADMTDLYIDKEDVHHRKKWRKNVIKRKSNPIWKRTINSQFHHSQLESQKHLIVVFFCDKVFFFVHIFKGKVGENKGNGG